MKYVCMCLLVAGVCTARAELVRAVDAEDHIGEQVTLQFTVKGIGQSEEGDFLELYSEKFWDDPGSVFLRVPRRISTRLQALGLTDVQSLFMQREIQAEGVLDWLTFEDAPAWRGVCLTLDDPNGVHILPSAFITKEQHGFTLRIDKSESTLSRREFEEVEAAIDSCLAEMVRMVPPGPLVEMRKIPVTVRRSASASSAMYDWRQDDESLVLLTPWQGVVVNNWYEFIRTSREDQPLALLHEFAHAYHHQVLGEDHPGILKAYGDAMSQNLYQSVKRLGQARPEPAYATTNDKEYFCELTEAWFGANDFFPFNHHDLLRYDPCGAALMQEIWGEPVTRHGE